jgi:ribose-phosphate pyrophosphokinase
LDELYSIETTTITSAGPIAEWIGANVARPFLLGPDVESQQWVGRIAAQIAAPFTVFSKERRGDLAVQISAGELDLADHTPVIVDDIISSAHTMAEAVTLLRHRGHAAPVCIGVHGLFSSGGLAVLRSSEPQDILVSDTVDHAMTRFSVSQPLIEAVSAWVASQ